MYQFVRRIPARTMLYLVAGWIVLAVCNFWFMKAGFYTDVPTAFPISVFKGPTLHFSGIPAMLLFLVVLACAVRFAPQLTVFQVWFIGLALIILGNLGQGSWDSAFAKPFYGSGKQYYHDAIKMASWPEWLASFNAHQSTLLNHSRTHPPFAVLSHYLVLHLSANSIPLLSTIFVLLSSLSIVLVWHMFRILCVPREKGNQLALLFSVIPAVNIYSAVSLDGLVLTGATLFLFGVVVQLKSARLSLAGLVSIAGGLTITNLLSYGGVFLFAVAGIQAYKEFRVSGGRNVAVSLLISICVLLAVAIALYSIYGYNHLQGFFTASALENPDGFRGWHEPFRYVATRMEGISEIALFLSFGFLAFLFHPDKLGISYSDWRNIAVGLVLSGLITLLAMFAGGVFRTGETARAALYIYPYIILALTNADSAIVKDILIGAGLQTAAMQLSGGYFW